MLLTNIARGVYPILQVNLPAILFCALDSSKFAIITEKHAHLLNDGIFKLCFFNLNKYSPAQKTTNDKRQPDGPKGGDCCCLPHGIRYILKKEKHKANCNSYEQKFNPLSLLLGPHCTDPS